LKKEINKKKEDEKGRVMWWRLRPIFVPLGAAIRAPDDVIVSGFDSRIFHPRERGRLCIVVRTTSAAWRHSRRRRKMKIIVLLFPLPFARRVLTPGDDQRPSLVSV